MVYCFVCGIDFLVVLQLVAVCCFVFITVMICLLVRKFCSFGTGLFLVGGNFEFVCGDYWYGCWNCCYLSVGCGILFTGGNYCCCWVDFFVCCSAGDCCFGDWFWFVISDYCFDFLRCVVCFAGDICRVGSD